MMNKSGQGMYDFFLLILVLFIGIGLLLYNNHVRINTEEEQSLYPYMSQVVKKLRKVDYNRLDLVVPQEKRLTEDGRAYYQIVLGEETTHKDNKRTRTAHVKIELKNSNTFIEKTIMLSSDKNDYKEKSASYNGCALFHSYVDILELMFNRKSIRIEIYLKSFYEEIELRLI